MATPIRKLRTDGIQVSDGEILLRLAANAEDARSLELLLDRHRWVIEDEVSYCFGRPPWFDSAVAAVLVEIVRGAAKYTPKRTRPHNGFEERPGEQGKGLSTR